MTEPTWSHMFRVFLRIGLLSFGGPAAQIALMHKELVEDRDWLSERKYLQALSFCMLLPGPEAMQLATYAGWRLRGIPGGFLAGSLFVLPGAIIVAALALAYGVWGRLDITQAIFLGVKACVVVIVFNALAKVARKALHGALNWALALGSFLAIFAFAVPFPLVVLAAGLLGFAAAADNRLHAEPPAAPAKRPSFGKTAALVGTLAVAWGMPIAVLALTGQAFLVDIALFFSKLAVVTFGGAYAVLTYMTQAMVQDYGWISTAQMMDALGLAETTPGPLILVTEFVALLAGQAQGGWPLGLAAGLVALWVTFLPCFIWIFAGAPYLDWISAQPRLAGALSAITAAVVGVIFNLSLWFATYFFFAEVSQMAFGPARFIAPEIWSLNPRAVVLAAVAAVTLVWWRLDMIWVLLITALLGGMFYGVG